MISLSIRRFALVFAMAAFAASFFFHPLKPAYACSCVPAAPPAAARDEAQAVFSGVVSAVQPGNNSLLVTFDVDQIWKGPEGAQLTLSTPGSSASCGYEFVQGEQYLVYGFAQEGQLATNLCTRTAPLANAGEDLAALGNGAAAPEAPVETPVEVSAELPWLPIALGGAVVAVAAVAAVVLRRQMGRRSA